jgi:C-terminal processing protease CtpA/Prc
VRKQGAVLTAAAFSWPDKARFFDFTHDCFARIAAAGATRLVIDIRQNGGGDDDMWRDGLLRYIADRPYKHGSRYIKRVLQPRAQGEVAGEIVSGEIETAAAPPADEPLRFAGQVYVLVSPLTYSSAVLFSNVVQDYGFAKIAGVGGAVRTRQSGGVQSLRLPNTGLLLFYPRFVLERPSGTATPTYVEPDLPFPDDPLRQQAAVDALLGSNGPPSLPTQ